MHMICTILLATFVTPLVKTASQLVLHGNVFFFILYFLQRDAMQARTMPLQDVRLFVRLSGMSVRHRYWV